MDESLAALATPAEAASYRELGYFVRERVLPAARLAELRDAVEQVHRRIVEASLRTDAARVERIDGKRYQQLLGSTVKWEWREDATEIRSMEPFAELDPRLDTLIDDPRLWRPAASLLGLPRVSLFTDKLNFKRPGGAPFPWHQDSPYFAFDCPHLDKLTSVQLYLDDATKENGCLWMIPGSHRNGMLPAYQDRGVLGRLYTDLEQIDASNPQPIEAPAGSVIFFHGDVVHGSRSNHTSDPRRALVLTYQPPDEPRWRSEQIRPVG